MVLKCTFNEFTVSIFYTVGSYAVKNGFFACKNKAIVGCAVSILSFLSGDETCRIKADSVKQIRCFALFEGFCICCFTCKVVYNRAQNVCNCVSSGTVCNLNLKVSCSCKCCIVRNSSCGVVNYSLKFFDDCCSFCIVFECVL